MVFKIFGFGWWSAHFSECCCELVDCNLQLPLPVDIVKHPKELDGKSTAVHAALLAPADVHIYSYPVIPDYTQQKVNKNWVYCVYSCLNNIIFHKKWN